MGGQQYVAVSTHRRMQSNLSPKVVKLAPPPAYRGDPLSVRGQAEMECAPEVAWEGVHGAVGQAAPSRTFG